jgi:3-hydroxyisobutyrate dehydrogenase
VAGPLRAGSTVAFIGLGRMGLPMARRLAAGGFRVRGYDPSEQARAALAAIAGRGRRSARRMPPSAPTRSR